MKFDVCATGIEISGEIEVPDEGLHEDYRPGGKLEEFASEAGRQCAMHKFKAKMTAALTDAGLRCRDGQTEYRLWETTQ
jgi:hypothetical protein